MISLPLLPLYDSHSTNEMLLELYLPFYPFTDEILYNIVILNKRGKFLCFHNLQNTYGISQTLFQEIWKKPKENELLS